MDSRVELRDSVNQIFAAAKVGNLGCWGAQSTHRPLSLKLTAQRIELSGSGISTGVALQGQRAKNMGLAGASQEDKELTSGAAEVKVLRSFATGEGLPRSLAEGEENRIWQDLVDVLKLFGVLGPISRCPVQRVPRSPPKSRQSSKQLLHGKTD